MAKIDINNYLKASLSEALNNGGYIDIDAMVDEGINEKHINSEMTRKEAERYYWMRTAETCANAYGFYSISRGVYMNYENASMEELDLMISNIDTSVEGYEKRLRLLIEERKRRDKEHCDGQMELTATGAYRERRTLIQILADKKAKQEAVI